MAVSGIRALLDPINTLALPFRLSASDEDFWRDD